MMDIRTSPAILATLGIFLLSALGTSGAGTETPMIADLSVKDLSIEGSKDGIKVMVVIENIGKAPSDQSALVLRDENDIGVGSAVLISRIAIQSIDPGRSLTKEVDWGGIKGPTHRIWAIIDVPAVSEDLNPWNNVRSSIVELPRIEAIGSPMDGDPDPDRIGTIFSGVPASFPMEIRYSHLTDPALVHVYFDNPAGGSTFTQTDPDGVTRTTLDLGAYAPGDHELAVRVTASGTALLDNVTSVSCRDVPKWIGALGSYSARFDPEEGCYVFSGTSDLPELLKSVPIGDTGREAPLSICGGGSDIQYTVRVMTDMTTTLEYTANVRFTIGSTTRSVRIAGTSFSADPEGTMEMTSKGSVQAEVDIQGPVGSDALWVDNGLGGFAPIIELPALTGNLSAMLHLKLESGRMVQTLWTGISLGGNLTQTTSGEMAGLDSAVTVVRERVDWDTTHELLSDGKWKDGGAVEGSIDIEATDLGFATKEGHGRGIHGLSLIGSDGGNLSYVTIPQDDGSNRSIKYISNDEEMIVHASNIYKSDPSGVMLSDGRAMVAWTEGWYASDWNGVYSKLRVRCSVQQFNDSDFQDPIAFGDSTTRSPQLLILGGGNEAALIFITDPDGDPATSDDQYLAIAYFDGSNWSGPVRIGERTTKGPYSAASDGIGGTISAAVAGGGLEIVRTGTSTDRSWTYINGTVLSLRAGRSGTGTLQVAYSISDPVSKGTLLVAREIRPDLSLGPEELIDGSDGIIGQLQLMADPDGVLSLAWTDSQDSSETIRATILSEGLDPGGWLVPISAKADPGPKLSFGSFPIGDGLFTFGWLEETREGGRSSIGEGVPYTGLWDLSDACDITEVTETLPDDYTSGQTFVVYVDLKSRGLGPSSTVQVDLLKVVRESTTGNISTNIAGSKTVSVVRGTKIEFPVTVSENQLGLYLVCGGPGWSGPDHVSSVYLSLPAVTDPRFVGVDYRVDPSGEVIAKARLENGGAMATGQRNIRLMGSTPTLPMVFPDHVKEPAMLRSREGGEVLNWTVFHLDPYENRTVELRTEVVPGTRLLWMEIDNRPWERAGISEPFVARSLPVIEGSFGGSVFVQEGSDPVIAISVRNIGSCSISQLPKAGISPIKGLVILEPSKEYTIVLKDHEGNLLDSYEFDVEDLAPGESKELDTAIIRGLSGLKGNICHISGSWDGRIPLAAGSVAGIAHRRMFTLPQPSNISLSAPEMGSASSSRTLTLKAFNEQNRSVQSLVLVLYNGLPSDMIVVSSVLVPELAPLSNVTLTFNVGLPEGRYLLTVESSVPDGTMLDGSVLWKAVGRSSGEYIVRNVTEEHPPGTPKATDKEIQRALVLSGSIGSAIFLGALANRAFEGSRRAK